MRRETIQAGRKYGRWTVVGDSALKSRGGKRIWLCRCECGTERGVVGTKLKAGRSLSCGCLRVEALKTHGCHSSATYETWKRMLQRCRNENSPDFSLYGGRGVCVCKRWLSFDAFLSDMGERPENHTIDRLNSDGDYEPNNCRWATPRQQANNRRSNRCLHYNGHRYTLSELSEVVGVKRATLARRLSLGFSVSEAAHWPLRTKRLQVERLDKKPSSDVGSV